MNTEPAVDKTMFTYKKPMQSYSGNIGGLFIAMGGVILISQNEKEDIDNIKEFKFNTTLAYSLITIGGVFIALGN